MDKEVKIKFIKVVEKQTDLYKGLAEVIKAEQKAISGNDIKEIDNIVKKEDAAILEIKKLEEEKRSLFAVMTADLRGSKGPDLKLADILPKMDKNDAAEIEKKVVGLLNAAREVEMTNKNNALLLKNYAGYVSVVKMFKEKLEKKPEHETYTAKGAIKKGKTVDKSGIDRTI